jgi:Domain of unknown function (DUF1918)
MTTPARKTPHGACQSLPWVVLLREEDCSVKAKTGDRIIVESEKVGTRPREGEILEVIGSLSGDHYGVRWTDGHESDFRPAAGSARIIPTGKTKRA